MADVVKTSTKLQKTLEIIEFVQNAPAETCVTAVEASTYLRLGKSTFWKFVNEGLVRRPTKLGAKVSLWHAGYVRELASKGIKGGE